LVVVSSADKQHAGIGSVVGGQWEGVAEDLLGNWVHHAAGVDGREGAVRSEASGVAGIGDKGRHVPAGVLEERRVCL